MDKVCHQLGIIEKDYFGLQYAGSKGETLWLNLRNRISRQLSGTPPYRLRLRVKFFVQPHFLLQDATRFQFYLQVKTEVANGNVKCEDEAAVIQLASLIAQAEFGDFRENGLHLVNYSQFLPPEWGENSDIMQRVAFEHAQLSGLRPESAWYRMLQAVSALPCFGVEYHQVQFPFGGRTCSGYIGVGPKDIALYTRQGELLKSISYPAVRTVRHTTNNRTLYLDTVHDDGSPLELCFKLISDKAANGLYRSVTEMHSFYRCDTIRLAVASQFSRDLKGTLASLFNENTTLGTNYVFDIQRTCREAYDHYRRKLCTQLPSVMHTDTTPPSGLSEDHNTAACHECSMGTCQEVKSHLEHIQDTFMCRVCMDADINTTFCPCGHLVCCDTCAQRLDTCPICRSSIQQTQYIFLPDLHYAAS
jgi:E3 ubiquitin-protein ligase MYLIP